jgi:hypothetical protein
LPRRKDKIGAAGIDRMMPKLQQTDAEVRHSPVCRRSLRQGRLPLDALANSRDRPRSAALLCPLLPQPVHGASGAKLPVDDLNSTNRVSTCCAARSATAWGARIGCGDTSEAHAE